LRTAPFGARRDRSTPAQLSETPAAVQSCSFGRTEGRLRHCEVSEMSTTESGGAVATTRQFYELLGTGNFEDATALLDDEFVIHSPKALPYGGDYHGKEGFGQLVANMLEGFDPVPIGTPDYVGGEGDVVAVRIPSRFTWRASGQSVDMNVVEVATVRDGKIVQLDIYYKDPGALATLAA
jgi:uncharacterized protein